MSTRVLQRLTQVFAQLGASAEQAPVMAAQLLKRAHQVAEERGITETAALAELLTKVTAGRRGEYGAEPMPPGKRPGQESD